MFLFFEIKINLILIFKYIREYDKLMEEQERLKRRQAELEALRNRQMEKLNQQRVLTDELFESGLETSRSTNKSSKNVNFAPENETRKNQFKNSSNYDNNFDERYLTEFQTNQNEAHLNSNRNKKSSKEIEALNQSALLIQNAYRGFQDRQKVIDLKRKKFYLERIE